MHIEKHWEDVSVYFVEFRVKNCSGEIRKICRTLVFGEDIKKEKVSKLVRSNFSNVYSIDLIELFDDMGLKLRM